MYKSKLDIQKNKQRKFTKNVLKTEYGRIKQELSKNGSLTDEIKRKIAILTINLFRIKPNNNRYPNELDLIKRTVRIKEDLGGCKYSLSVGTTKFPHFFRLFTEIYGYLKDRDTITQKELESIAKKIKTRNIVKLRQLLILFGYINDGNQK